MNSRWMKSVVLVLCLLLSIPALALAQSGSGNGGNGNGGNGNGGSIGAVNGRAGSATFRLNNPMPVMIWTVWGLDSSGSGTVSTSSDVSTVVLYDNGLATWSQSKTVSIGQLLRTGSGPSWNATSIAQPGSPPSSACGPNPIVAPAKSQEEVDSITAENFSRSPVVGEAGCREKLWMLTDASARPATRSARAAHAPQASALHHARRALVALPSRRWLKGPASGDRSTR